jgi:hypothetical protein
MSVLLTLDTPLDRSLYFSCKHLRKDKFFDTVLSVECSIFGCRRLLRRPQTTLAMVFDKPLAPAFAHNTLIRGMQMPFCTAKSKAERRKISGFGSNLRKEAILHIIVL